ncbi:MAG: hypothetical protein JSV78_06785 [Phycisphaerales bacterium]|nr:MAG: hypothetical protein JSV78_06785 [Phycisphaerales bacterium]
MRIKAIIQTSVLVPILIRPFGGPALGDVRIHAAQTGTMLDGSIFGPFDGFADHADWYPDACNYAGSMALVPLHGMEQRVVFKYDLSELAAETPVQAALHLTLRGGTKHGMPDAEVRVYSYVTGPSLVLSDFHDGPAVLRASVAVPCFQPPTAFVIEISGALNDALAAGAEAIAFRLQIDPDSEETGSQAFLYGPDFQMPFRPYIEVQEGAPSDCDGDGDVDLIDFGGFAGCLLGPGGGIDTDCDCFDLDDDGDVDLGDFAVFQAEFTG